MKGHHRNFHFEISDPLPVRGCPLKPGGISHLLLEASWGMMINEKTVRNFVLNENHYDIFPLAAIFGTPYIRGMGYRRYQIWPPGEKFHNVFN